MNKENIISKILTIVGLVLFMYGLILCILSNLNAGVLLVTALGVFFSLTGVFYRRIIRYSASGFFKVCKHLIIFLLCAETAFVSFIAVYGAIDNVSYTEDAVIVLGAAIRGDRVTLPLKLRLDKAIEYHRCNPEALIVVSGAQGFQETVTEAYAMEKYLVENGVDKSAIIKEEKATSTAENMKYSKMILDDRFDNDYSVAVITNNFHIFRGTFLARRYGFENVFHMHAGLQWYNLMPCYLRESLAVLKSFVAD